MVRNRLAEFVLLLPASYQTLGFVNPSLKAFGVKEVEFIGKSEVIKSRRLFLPTHTAPSGHYNEEIIRGVRSLLLQSYGAEDPGEGSRVYLSRARAPKRRISNEKAVVDVLAEFEFQTIYAEDLSFEQQVKICSRARYLVSNHGAGLSNMLFMPQGASVLELRHQTDRINNCYFTLSSALELSYFYQSCQSEISNEDPHTADLVVDPKALRANLNLMIGS